MNIFDQSKSLMNGVFYRDIVEYPTFTYLRSVFTDDCYNLIEPLVPFADVEWNAIKHLIRQEHDQQMAVSFYLSETLLSSYQSILKDEGYQQTAFEAYLTKQPQARATMAGEGARFVEVTDQNAGIYLQLVEECFPEYSNNKEYTDFYRHVSNLHNPTDSHIFNYNIMLYKQELPVSFGSLILSTKLQLGYLHNMGTAPAYRHQGLFTAVTSFLESKAVSHGVDTIYVNAEVNGASYRGFLKHGYAEDCRYHLFSVI